MTEIIEVSDETIRSAVRLLFNLVNLKSEPTGALTLGAILENKDKFKNKKSASSSAAAMLTRKFTGIF